MRHYNEVCQFLYAIQKKSVCKTFHKSIAIHSCSDMHKQLNALLHHNCLILEKAQSTDYGKKYLQNCTAVMCELLAVVADCSNVMFNALWEWEEVSVCCQHGVMDSRAMGVGGGIHPISGSCNG